ncbi:MAG: hypothetical protein DLM52_08835 [Chthoniobacterales bacterium]|nr:MAG: hypothetical protein DLM52_08835 [Chthoniobacterales bacterium]
MLAGLVIATVCGAHLFAAPDEPVRAGQSRTGARLNCGARVACITPDGLLARMAPARQDKGAAVLILEDDSISCPMNAGETTFVVALPAARSFERLKFVNENAAARGMLRIAVANEELPAKSQRWVPVDGNVAFENKRLFDVSMVGVEAKFVRVTFTVERSDLSLAGIEPEPGRRFGTGLFAAQP